nr:MAG TPA: hypothetical protein [Caudoviricetes sp.]
MAGSGSQRASCLFICPRSARGSRKQVAHL